MDRVSQLRGGTGASGSGDSTLDTTSPPSEAFMSANESSSKYFSFADSTFDISHESLASTSADSDPPDAELTSTSNVSPIGNREILDFNIGRQIDAANILSGGENIFEGNDNSFDGDELVIDDNAVQDDTVAVDDNAERVEDLSENVEPEPKPEHAPEREPENGSKEPKPVPAHETQPELQVEQLQLEPEPELEGEPELELELDPEPVVEPQPVLEIEPERDDILVIEPEAGPAVVQPEANEEMEVVLQIDGINLNAVGIGNGLYLYRRDGEEELAAIQINSDDPQNGYKLLKVRDNAEGNLEVYEEIEIEVSKAGPSNEENPVDNNTPNVPIVESNKVTSNSSANDVNVGASTSKGFPMEPVASTSSEKVREEKESSAEPKADVNVNGRMKFSESRKSPVVGSFTPMTFHSTPNKEGKPLTKTMVDLQLDPNRHSDNVKKTIEVHTDNIKQKSTESSGKDKEIENIKSTEGAPKHIAVGKNIENTNDKNEIKLVDDKNKEIEPNVDNKSSKTTKDSPKAEETIEKLDIKSESKDSKSNLPIKSSNQEPTAIVAYDGVETEDPPINNNNGDVAVPKVSNSAVAQPPMTNDTSTTSISATDQNVNSKIDEDAVKCKSEKSSVESVIKEDETQDCDKDKIIPNDIGELHTLDTPSENAKIVAFDSVSDVSSTSTNLVRNSSTVNSQVSCMDGIVENVRLTTSTGKTQGDEEDISDKITKDQTKIDMPNSKTVLVQQEIETIDQVDSTSSMPFKVNSYAKVEEKTTEISTSVPLPSAPQLKSSDIISKSSVPESTVQSADKQSVSTPEGMRTENEEMRTEKKSTSIPVAKVKPPVNVEALSTEPLPHPTEKDSRPLYAAGRISSEQKVHSVSVTQLKSIEKVPNSKSFDKTAKPVMAPDVKLFEKNPQRPSVPEAIPLQNAAVLPILTDSRPPEKVVYSLAMPIVKPSDRTPHSATSPTVKPIDIATSSVVEPTVMLPKEIAPGNSAIVHATELRYVDKAALPTPKLNATSTKDLVNSIPIPIESIPGKVAHLITAPVVKPIEKLKLPMVPVVPPEKNISSASLPEIKKRPLEISSDTIIKPARSDAHIPVVANIGNKPSSKHISLLAKTEGVKKAIDIVPKTKEVSAKKIVEEKTTQIKIESREIKVPIPSGPNLDIKPANNNHSAPVPFGKWTEANRQEFLNKFNKIKAPVSTNSKQIKNSNDLNRRDVLKKIDSQRAQTIINNTAKAQEKMTVKNETVFSSKVVAPKVETKIPVKNESTDKKPKQTINKVPIKQENSQKTAVSSTVSASSAAIPKVEPAPREGKATATMANLIDMTIEDMINRVIVPPSSSPPKSVPDEPKQIIKNIQNDLKSATPDIHSKKTETEDSESLDDIEMKMNELHGIPFVERPPHQLPMVAKTEITTFNIKHTEKEKPIIKDAAIPKLFTVEPKNIKENVIDIESEDEVIEHEPVTGDIYLNKEVIKNALPVHVKKMHPDKSSASEADNDASNKDFITEKDFDKFARRNSITYENCLTVTYDPKEPHSLVQTVKEKDQDLHVNPKTEMIRIEPKLKLPHKQPLRQNTKDSSSKNYHSKIHSAYQSALTAKHQVTQPITIIEDKPVKVVFVESSTGFNPSQLNVQGQELSPAKKTETELDNAATNNTDVVDSELLRVIDENKQQDKTKTKHQRKQVLTPVEAPELELIQPNDIGIETSPKKRRKIDDSKLDKQSKNLVHKKSYLLGRNTPTDDKTIEKQVVPKDLPKEIINRNEEISDHKDAASAIDNLVKAAELLENQAETNMSIISLSTDSQSNTPVKRGRGRPRKYPLPEGTENRTPSPQKKPRLIDAKPIKRASFSDEQDDYSSGDDIIRENWTMGKINENIVCPICNKLFRSENVVFKHVKHCTGVSPNRSDSDKTSPRRSRLSQESEDMDYELSITEYKKQSPKKRKSKESSKDESKPAQTKLEMDKDEVIVIEDTSINEKLDKKSEENSNEDAKVKMRNRANNLVCEFCGKTFRQLSYLVSHELQHKKEQKKKTEKETQDSKKLQVFSCEVCKKEFRKLHHLVQHRIIHNPDTVPKRTLRKSSSEQNDNKLVKEETVGKQHEDASAGFRCEPCDKSFRKLHHLVEHRETHDGINRQKPSVPAQPVAEKPPPPPQCEICKKTFRKLHHLIEHKEQHADTSSEKSESVKSLSTKDIIHECSLCYMVFPNEHSLNKHSGICSKKKRQSKQTKDIPESESGNEEQKSKPEDKKDERGLDDVPKIIEREVVDENISKELGDKNLNVESEIQQEIVLNKSTITETKLMAEENISYEPKVKALPNVKDVKSPESSSKPAKRVFLKSEGDKLQEKTVVPEKIKKIDQKENKIQDAPKKKIPLKDKVAPTVAKRKKTVEGRLPTANQLKPSVESSDDDEIRYMLNPNYKVEETVEGKTFMKIRAAKRNSLQIERPNYNDHAKRRISLQHPPKISRLKPKVAESKPKAAETTAKAPEPKPETAEPRSKTIESKAATNMKHIGKLSETEALLSTDSDDSDIKYSFPKSASEIPKLVERTPKEAQRKTTRKSMEKRKSLVGIAKRKSLGKAITVKHKVTDAPARLIKKRSAEVEHRCDCGQLFTSAALLSRHTSIAHTPPRIRRRRDASPPPANKPKPAPSNKPTAKANTLDSNPKPVSTRKSSANTEPANPNKTRKHSKTTDKSNVKSDATDSKLPVRTRKSSLKTESATSTDNKPTKLAKKTENLIEKKKDNSSGKKAENSTTKKIGNSTGKKKAKDKKTETSTVKTRRSGAHAGVPLPAKMRKLMQSL